MPSDPPFIDWEAKGLGCGPLSSHRWSWAVFLHHLLSCNAAEAGLDARSPVFGMEQLGWSVSCLIATVYVMVCSFLCEPWISALLQEYLWIQDWGWFKVYCIARCAMSIYLVSDSRFPHLWNGDKHPHLAVNCYKQQYNNVTIHNIIMWL